MTPQLRFATGLASVHAMAASPAFAHDGICYAAGDAGLRISRDGGRTWSDAYAALNLQTPLTTAAVALSPTFADDKTLFAGVLGGVLRSTNGGETWHAAALPPPMPFITALAVSPHYAEDGLVFAASMEDGVLRSWDRGEQWAAWNFGLLDLNVYSLALSPRFAHDDTLYTGTESGIFRSRNGGRAWRETAFPMESAPVLSLAVAHDHTSGNTIFAGTEEGRLWFSADAGASWQPYSGWETSGPINALLLAAHAPNHTALLVATNHSIHVSCNSDGEFRTCVDMTNADDRTELTCAVAPAGISPGAPLLAGTHSGDVLICQIP